MKRLKLSITRVSSSGRTFTKALPLVSPYNINKKNIPSVPLAEHNHHQQDAFVDVGLNIGSIPTCGNPWIAFRNKIKETYYCAQSPKCHVKCFDCGLDLNMLDHNFVICEDCGPNVYLCLECCMKTHDGKKLQRNLFHKPKQWKGHGYEPVPINVFLAAPHCQSSSCAKSLKTGLQVFDGKGRLHECMVTFCKCEPVALTLLRNNIWPASTMEPTVGFHLDFMDWVEFLILESSLSLQSICLAVRWKNHLSDHEYQNTLYRHLVGDCLEEYLFFKYQVRELDGFEGLGDGTECTACPKESGNLYISMDGNVGLVRKDNAGYNADPPRHGSRLFADQKTVDRHVEKYVKSASDKIAQTKDCSTFQAGSVVRAKNKTERLDQKGVFGAACRHGIPKMFMSMSYGERLAYPLMILQTLLNETKTSNVKLHVLYDIACLLDIHTKNHDPLKYDGVDLAVPVFHAFGHKYSCQVMYSCRWRPGYGLTDGEVMERLWSFLRRFSDSTKEMTPGHRIDRLTAALLHYAKKKIHEIDVLLCRSLIRACNVIEVSSEKLDEILRKYSLNRDDVKKWVEEEPKRAKTVPLRGKRAKESEKAELLKKLHMQAIEYAFVCTLRTKYSKGQAVANRINKTIANSSKHLRSMIEEYNDLRPQGEALPPNLEWKQASSPESDVYKSLNSVLFAQIQGKCIPITDMHKAADSYNHLQRATEEIDQTKYEMMTHLENLLAQHSTLHGHLRAGTSRGLQDTVYQKLKYTASMFERGKKLFATYIDLSALPSLPNVAASAESVEDVSMEEDIFEEIE